MKRLGVVVHPTRAVQEPLEVLRSWSEEHGVELVQIHSDERPSVAPPGEVNACDLIAAVGGDGTVLNALHTSAKTGTPVLGVAYGSLGALTAVPGSELRRGLDQFAAGTWSAQQLTALKLRTAEGPLGWALNDLVLARRGGTQLLLDLCVDDELYARLAGDGIVVSTACGSSAYSMAAGGPLLMEGTRAFLCTPLAMHGGCAPPLVIPDDREVTLALHPSHDGYAVEIDGLSLPSESHWFAVSGEQAYGTLVVPDGSHSGLPRLRERGLIRDSPRVLAEIARRRAISPRGA